MSRTSKDKAKLSLKLLAEELKESDRKFFAKFKSSPKHSTPVKVKKLNPFTNTVEILPTAPHDESEFKFDANKSVSLSDLQSLRDLDPAVVFNRFPSGETLKAPSPTFSENEEEKFSSSFQFEDEQEEEKKSSSERSRSPTNSYHSADNSSKSEKENEETSSERSSSPSNSDRSKSPSHGINMDYTFTYFEKKLTSQIPKFSNHKKDLKKFLNSVESAFKSIPAEHQGDVPALLQTLITFHCSAHVYDILASKTIATVADFKRELSNAIIKHVTIESVQSELNLLRQLPSESVEAFAIRIKNHEIDFVRAYSLSPVELTEAVKNQLIQQALFSAFTRYLRPGLNHICASQDYKSIDEAVIALTKIEAKIHIEDSATASMNKLSLGQNPNPTQHDDNGGQHRRNSNRGRRNFNNRGFFHSQTSPAPYRSPARNFHYQNNGNRFERSPSPSPFPRYQRYPDNRYDNNYNRGGNFNRNNSYRNGNDNSYRYSNDNRNGNFNSNGNRSNYSNFGYDNQNRQSNGYDNQNRQSNGNGNQNRHSNGNGNNNGNSNTNGNNRNQNNASFQRPATPASVSPHRNTVSFSDEPKN